MCVSNPLGAIVAAESAIRILLHVRHCRSMRGDVRFWIARHIAAIRVLRSVA